MCMLLPRCCRFFKYVFSLGLIIGLCLPLTAQKTKPKPADFGIKSKKALEYFMMGESLSQRRQQREAIAAYKEALEKEPEFARALYRIGTNEYFLKNYPEALTYLMKAREVDSLSYNPYYIAESLFYTGEYADAIPHYELFLERKRGRKRELINAAMNLRNASFAAHSIQNPIEFAPQNLGAEINSRFDEYLPYLTADDSYLLFTAKRPDAIGGFNPELQDYAEDFYFSRLVDGKWQEAENLGVPINTPYNEGAPSISQDGNTIYFTACNRIDGLGSCDIYVAHKEGDSWGLPENLGPKVNSPAWDSHPYFSHDGKFLFFTSVRGGGKGGQDIWMSRWENGEWSEAENLGAAINTPGQESSPFLHADGVSLYFASDFHPGFGKSDIFRSQKQIDDSWGRPKNLGYPLNTNARELNIFINASGDKGLINSTREGGFGKSDIYEFKVDSSIRPKPATFLRGWVIDSVSDEPLSALINLVDIESGDTLRQVSTNSSDGKFLMSLPLEKEYAASVQAPGYLFASKRFVLSRVEDGSQYFDIRIPLVAVKAGSQVVLRNIFFATGSYELSETSVPELNVLYKFLTTNPNLEIEIQGHTDDVGSDKDNLSLSQQRADAVRDYLVEMGIPQERISSKGYGENQPIADNETEEGRSENRRTAFKVVAE